jgi:hypothetical protein
MTIDGLCWPFARFHLRRADLAIDSLLPAFPQVEASDIVSRGRKRAFYWESEQLTGLSVGRSDVVCRIYDKPVECARDPQKLEYWLGVWGLDSLEGQSVMRVEYQLRRGLLGEFGIETLWDLLQVQGDLLRYLTGEWFRLGGPACGEDHSRVDLPLWAWVRGQVAGLQLGTLGVVRAAFRRLPDIKGLGEQALGVVASLAAGLGLKEDLGRSMSVQEVFAWLLRSARWGEWGVKSTERYREYRLAYVV